ncbi:MAG: hypothetical protein ACP5D7_01500 [Limnospira sp.]
MLKINKKSDALILIAGLVLGLSSPAIATVAKQPEKSPFIGDLKVQNPSFIDRDNQTQRQLIQSEVDHTLRRLNPFINTWILVAVLVPGAISMTILIWFFREAQHVQTCRQTLEGYKEDIRDRIEYLASEAQDILDKLQMTMNLTEEKIEAIESHIQSLSIEDEKDSDFSVDGETSDKN